ncbi:MAG TPA: DUF4012 domain-containing protein [Patescibacteria group bacterium]|nr:DUF4012 domain-containing protein [Patescibacteria group bacterium]
MTDTARPSYYVESDKRIPVALVAGGAGFLGAHLCESLVAENLIVVCVDNLSVGKKSNISHLLDNKNFVFLQHDINEPFPEGLTSADYIFHLAGVEEYINGLDLSMETLLVNSIGTKNLLEFARKTRAKFLLLSTLDIYQGVMSSLSLDHYFGVTERDTKLYTHHEAKRYAEALTSEYHKKFQVDARIVRIIDVYGPKMDLQAGTPIAFLVRAASQSEQLTIRNDGLDAIFPVYVSDVVSGLKKGMFVRNTEGKIYHLTRETPDTTINFAYELQRQSEKRLHVVFAPHEEGVLLPPHKIDVSQTYKELQWEPSVLLPEGVKKTLDWFTHTKQEVIKELPRKEREDLLLKKKSSRFFSFKLPQISLPKLSFQKGNEHVGKLVQSFRPLMRRFGVLLASFIVVFMLLLLPVLSLFFYSYTGIRQMESAYSLSLRGDFLKASQEMKRSESSFQRAKDITHSLTWFFSLVNGRTQLDQWGRALEVGELVSSAGTFVLQAEEQMEFVTNGFFSEQDPNETKKHISRANSSFDAAFDRISRAEAHAKTLQPEWYPSYVRPYVFQVKEKLPQLVQGVQYGREFTQMVPEVIGLQGRRDYLVLFQNNNELRPTGGFIGSFGLLTFENGKIVDWNVEDVYNADGRLKGYVEPPETLKPFLIELSPGSNPSWGLRDSNWDPNFPTSAVRAEWFLSKELEKEVQGVLAIDLTAASSLITSFGGIYLPDSNVTLTPENLSEYTKKHEETFFPGSTRKKDFLTELFSQLVEKLIHLEPNQMLKVTEALRSALEGKHMLLYFNDSSLQDTVQQLGWDGSMAAYDQDYLSVIDSNVGANKVDERIQRSLLIDTSVQEDLSLMNTITMTYVNSAKEGDFLQGEYKNYVRVYTPIGSQLVRVNLNLQEIPFEEVRVSTEAAYTIFATTMKVPIQSSQSLTLQYRIIDTQTTEGEFQYDFLYQKQPGVAEQTVEHKVHFPPFLEVKGILPSGIHGGNIVFFERTNVRGDFTHQVSFHQLPGKESP